ncbi:MULTISPECIES: PstS family phosphate ABC transporter substrate-binding protein [unclassified Dysgonomonas]|uniref:PstS family phosphate ABC transporter substrate-binding protein n=1 Tax=unclassified Dysgonomonas TaxID=2630389 RepID=UPI0013EDA1C9|nr:MULTISPECIES: substrate-binding domain-containing protein [unclassified Dysgonomonas]
MKKLSIIFCTIIILLSSCGDRRKITRTDTLTSGIAEIAVDECFAPIIQQQVDVFEALNPDATIIPLYTSEIGMFDLFMKDSLRLIIAARELTQNEINVIKDRQRTPRSQKIATDGIAIIVNKANTDTLVSVADLKKIFTGEVRTWNELRPGSSLGDIAIAFDSPNSSMVRYIKDSICGDVPLGSNLRARAEDAQQTIDINSERTPNQMVIDYVASTPNALGIIGVNWISNPSDTTNLSFINNVRVMSVSKEEKATVKDSYKPYPYQLALGKYPLTRDIYVIISDVSGGLTSGFVTFVAGDQGQRMITKAGLLPATRPMRLIRANPGFVK